jgi:diguanylate cyclase (GGDEF)-like protein
MNVSFGTPLVLVFATTAAAILLMAAWPSLRRARRERRFGVLDALLATSYIGNSQSTSSPMTGGPTAHPGAEPASDDAATAGLHGAHDAHRTLLDGAAFEEVVAHEDAREERYSRPTTVVVLELDGLDRLVDRLGAGAAERIEPDVADTIARLARRADYVARFAAGRYAVLMPETDEIVAINYVERIRQACDQWLESGAIAMRLAIGWASTAGTASVTTAMQVAVDRLHVEHRRHARGWADGARLGADGARLGADGADGAGDPPIA